MQHDNQFTWWIHKNLGKGIRRITTSCLLWFISDKFPKTGDRCVNYEEGDQRD